MRHANGRAARVQDVAGVDWDAYRKCKGCGAITGQACRSLSGEVVDGEPVEVAVTVPHVKRQLRQMTRGKKN